ncbi:MAG TPA: cupin domain-containing protein [Solirubrobacteraceae bacterium]|jgi:quercetin dioxygenase-like cupin family protein|nr:cupin domain-containing protein [Solirubrobacteraceae bacterium]
MGSRRASPQSSHEQPPWATGWSADRPLALDANIVFARDAGWESGLRPYLRYRDLGLAQASGGRLGAQRIRAREKLSSDWHHHVLDFQFFYVIAGSILIETARERRELGPGDSACHPSGMWHREAVLSEDYEVIEITGPAVVETITEQQAPLPSDAENPVRRLRGVYAHERAQDYEPGVGAERFIRLRDLGTSAPTGRRILTQTIRPAGAPPRRSAGDDLLGAASSQWLTVLSGSVELALRDRSRRTLLSGDAIALGVDPAGRQRATRFSEDFAALRICIPAERRSPHGDDTPVFAGRPEEASDGHD